MYGELTLSDRLQKVNVKIVGGSEDVIFTSVPTINNQPIILSKKHAYLLSFFNHRQLFKFLVKFRTYNKESNQAYFIFDITKKSTETNKRKQSREITDLPVLIETNSNEYQICRVLDISKTGAKIQCNQPIPSKNVTLHFQCQNSIKKIPSTLTWEMKNDHFAYYGVHF